MKATFCAPLGVAAAVALFAGCSGGGSSAPVAPIVGAGAPAAATFPLSFVIPAITLIASKARSPQYLSPATRSIAVYDGATIIYVGNFSAGTFTTVFAKTGPTSVSGGSCSVSPASAGSSACTVTVTTTPGAHAFDVIAYPNAQGTNADSNARAPQDVGTVPTFTGIILSEGELAVTLVSGPNPGQTIDPFGVADRAIFGSPNFTQQLGGDGPAVGVIGSSYTLPYTVGDAADVQIVPPPSSYDNGPVTITATSQSSPGPVVSMSPVSQSGPPASPGPQSLSFTCENAGTATFTATARTKPNATYASGLTYNSSNYSNGTLGTTTVQCASGSATLPITIDSGGRRK